MGKSEPGTPRTSLDENDKRPSIERADEVPIFRTGDKVYLYTNRLRSGPYVVAVVHDNSQYTLSDDQGNAISGGHEMELYRNTIFKHHAILIGIDDYPGEGSKLKSAVADIRKAEALLAKELLDGVVIHTLSAPQTQTQSSLEPSLPGSAPTLNRVIAVLALVTSQARAGDYVYIHYSGHGRSKPAQDADSEDDVALMLLDEDNLERVQELRGRDLAAMIHNMIEKGVLVTLVLDCCFSGSVFRSGSEVRCMPDAATSRPDIGQMQHVKRNRSASMRPNWMLNPERYTILTACGSHEETVGLQFYQDGRKENFGPLSYYLLETVAYVGLTRSMRIIFDRLRAKLQRDPKTRGQNPVLYGNKEQAFFGMNDLPGMTRSIPIVGLPDRTIQLQAGRAHGISEGDTFVLCSAKTIVSNNISRAECIEARVIQTGALTSMLSLDDQQNSTVHSGWLASIVTQRCLGTYSCYADLDMTGSEMIRAVSVARGIRIYTDAKDGYDFRISINDNVQYIFEDREANLLLSTAAEQLSATSVCDILEHIMRYKMLEALQNQPTSSDYLSNISIEIGYDDRIYPGTEEIAVADHAIVELIMRSSNKKPVYAYPFYLGSSWQAEQLWAGTYCTIYPNARVSKKISLSVPEDLKKTGIFVCQDTIKVLFTSQPTSFDMLELPQWDDYLPPVTATKTKRSNSIGPELWTSFNFRLLVRDLNAK